MQNKWHKISFYKFLILLVYVNVWFFAECTSLHLLRRWCQSRGQMCQQTRSLTFFHCWISEKLKQKHILHGVLFFIIISGPMYLRGVVIHGFNFINVYDGSFNVKCSAIFLELSADSFIFQYFKFKQIVIVHEWMNEQTRWSTGKTH